MKIKEIRELGLLDLINRSKELKHELINLRVQKQTGQLENPARIRNIRVEVARINTIITERNLEKNKEKVQ